MTTTVELPPCPSFDDFFSATHGGWAPLPWQSRLAQQIANGQCQWPDEIGVPTGLGKTTTIDIAVWALAAQADRSPAERTAPTRIWYVVNRRLLVDAASDHAERLARLLATSSPERNSLAEREQQDLIAISKRLQAVAGPPLAFFGADGTSITGPLYVSRLRGGSQSGRRPPHPGQPAIICATVPMFGSRLLFRGYGSSNGMWPIDAAHTGMDALVLLDEAHISQPLTRLINILPKADAPRAGALLPRHEPVPLNQLLPPSRSHPTVVSLTATGFPSAERFDLGAEDYENEVVRMRLDAKKATSLLTTEPKKLAAVLADTAVAQLSQVITDVGAPATAVIFVNSPRSALAVRTELGKHKGLPSGADIVTLTGQLRTPEAEAIRGQLADPELGAPSNRPTGPRGRPLIVIATQTLEVGADLDFDVLVSELAGVRAVTQRLGRLNRLGKRDHARAVLVEVTGAKPGVLYGDEPAAIAQRLRDVDLPIDLSPATIAAVLGVPNEAEPDVPELLGTHMWEFAKTSLAPPGAAPPEPFFSGLVTPDHLVSVCWRSVAPEVGSVLEPRPADLEFVDVSISDLADIGPLYRIDTNGAAIEVIESSDHLSPGDRVVLLSNVGRYSAAGWDPSSAAAVLDLSPLARRSIRVLVEAFGNLLGEITPEQEAIITSVATANPVSDQEDGIDFDPVLDGAAARLMHAWLNDAACPGSITEAFWDQRRGRNAVIERDPDGRRPRLVWRSETAVPGPRVDALDELSLAVGDGDQRLLDIHLRSVGVQAKSIATRIGLPPEIAGALYQAGTLHDLGKAHPGFQGWLGYEPAEQALFANRTAKLRALLPASQ